jgi:hypothetical protein
VSLFPDLNHRSSSASRSSRAAVSTLHVWILENGSDVQSRFLPRHGLDVGRDDASVGEHDDVGEQQRYGATVLTEGRAGPRERRPRLAARHR